MRRELLPRIVLFLAMVAGFAWAWRHSQLIPMFVVGQPSATGPLQQKMEEPFFAQLHASTGLPIKIDYKPLDAIGFKDVYQLQALKEGTFDLVSLRFMQNVKVEPGLLGIDMPGLIHDRKTARQAAAAYGSTLDRYLQERFNSKLLGLWSFGPQELFCRKPVSHLADLRGIRVRVASPAIATVVAELGAKPAVIAFEDTRDALANGLVDCAISSAQSANSAGWTKDAAYSLAIPFQSGINGYVISLDTWSAMTRAQQKMFARVFDTYTEELWRHSGKLYDDINRCHAGGVCRGFNSHRVKRFEPSASDRRLLQEIAVRKLFPQWATVCDRLHHGCSREWLAKVGPYLTTLPTPR